MTTIAFRISESRKRAGLNQSELARRLGITPQAVQKWEAGETIPRGQRLLALCEILSISIDYLMGPEEEPEIKPASAIDDPALPLSEESEASSSQGIQIRDYFAAKALPIVASYGANADRIAKAAYELADAMLRARKS